MAMEEQAVPERYSVGSFSVWSIEERKRPGPPWRGEREAGENTALRAAGVVCRLFNFSAYLLAIALHAGVAWFRRSGVARYREMSWDNQMPLLALCRNERVPVGIDGNVFQERAGAHINFVHPPASPLTSLRKSGCRTAPPRRRRCFSGG
jgi:hypothetical protein